MRDLEMRDLDITSWQVQVTRATQRKGRQRQLGHRLARGWLHEQQQHPPWQQQQQEEEEEDEEEEEKQEQEEHWQGDRRAAGADPPQSYQPPVTVALVGYTSAGKSTLHAQVVSQVPTAADPSKQLGPARIAAPPPRLADVVGHSRICVFWTGFYVRFCARLYVRLRVRLYGRLCVRLRSTSAQLTGSAVKQGGELFTTLG